MNCLYYDPSPNQYLHDYALCDYDLGLQYIQTWAQERPFKIDKPHIKQLYELLYKKEMTYRDHPCRVHNIDGSIVISFPPEVIPKYMNDFFDSMKDIIEKDRYDPIEASARAHAIIGRIHPFSDGNGHMARFVANAILLANGYHLLQFSPMNESLYSLFMKEYSLTGRIENFISYWRQLVQRNEEKYHG